MSEQFLQNTSAPLEEETGEDSSISGLLPDRTELALSLPDTFIQEVMSYVAGQINNVLRGTKLQTFPEIIIGDAELTYLSSNRVTQVGPYVFTIAGDPEEFAANQHGLLKRRMTSLQRRIGIYLDTYPDNVFIVPASHTVVPEHRKQYPISPHTALMAAQIATLRSTIPGLDTADLACGDGILSQILMAEQANSVFLLDYEDSLLSIADVLLKNRAAKKLDGGDGQETGVNIASQDLWHFKDLPGDGVADLAILHLGPFYDSNGPLHDHVVERLSKWPDTKMILSGGYQIVEPGHQEAFENAKETLSEAGYHVDTVQYRTLALLAAIRAGSPKTA